MSDFGMAKVLGDSSYYKSESMTMPYKWCSVEVLKYGKFSLASDVWAFGILLWYLKIASFN
jgi:serine/threonine protein kinase